MTSRTDGGAGSVGVWSCHHSFSTLLVVAGGVAVCGEGDAALGGWMLPAQKNGMELHYSVGARAQFSH